MKITVQRSSGGAGMKRTWTVQPEPPEDTDRWQPLIEACPWDDVAGTSGPPASRTGSCTASGPINGGRSCRSGN